MKATLMIFSGLVVLLAGCSTPRERCLNLAAQNLQTVEGLILDTQGNIQRGFGYVTDVRYTTALDWCYDPWGNVRTCTRTQTRPVSKPVAIDLEAEKRKLASLQKQRATLVKETNQKIASCEAQFPLDASAPVTAAPE